MTTDHLDRLRAMIAPGQQTWDLSEKDVEAIAAVVGHIDRMGSLYIVAIPLADEKVVNGRRTINIDAPTCLVSAGSEDEALGKATRIKAKIQGTRVAGTNVTPFGKTQVIDPDGDLSLRRSR